MSRLGPPQVGEEPVHFLAVGAHPDDVELGCGGTIASLVAQGYRGAILDLTRAELSTFGDPETREEEALKAAEILGVRRYCSGSQEAALYPSETLLHDLVKILRILKPSLLLSPFPMDRHPDHTATGTLSQEAAFWGGVKRYAPGLPPHRPRRVIFYFAHWEKEPSFIVDVSEFWEVKMRAVRAYQSQFEVNSPLQPLTFVGRRGFLERVETRARYYGSLINAQYGEPFYCRYPTRIKDVMRWCEEQGDLG